jgi:hypothetical protein
MALQDFNCVLCIGSIEETTFHLFLSCPFAIQCWSWLQVQLDPSLDPFQVFESFKAQIQTPFFMEIIILMCWTIWKARNDMIFRQIGPNLNASKRFFKEELQFLSLRLKRRHLPLFNLWIASLP